MSGCFDQVLNPNKLDVRSVSDAVEQTVPFRGSVLRSSEDMKQFLKVSGDKPKLLLATTQLQVMCG